MDLSMDVLLVHAFPKQIKAPVSAGLGYQEIFEEFAAQHEADEAVELSTEWANKGRDAGLDVEILARSADAAELILEAADREDVAMVIMGTQGKSGLKRFVLGSVAAEVVRRSSVPVLVVPRP